MGRERRALSGTPAPRAVGPAEETELRAAAGRLARHLHEARGADETLSDVTLLEIQRLAVQGGERALALRTAGEAGKRWLRAGQARQLAELVLRTPGASDDGWLRFADGRAALDLGDHRRARERLRSALADLAAELRRGEAPEGRRRMGPVLLGLLAEADVIEGNLVQAETALDLAIETARQLEDQDRLAGVLVRKADARLRRGDPALAAALLREAQHSAPSLGGVEPALATRVLTMLEALGGSMTPARRRYRVSVSALGRARMEGQSAEALLDAGRLELIASDAASAVEFAAEAGAQARALGRALTEASAAALLAAAHLETEPANLDAAFDAGWRAAALARLHRYRQLEGEALRSLALVAMQRGQARRAAAWLSRAIRLHQSVHDHGGCALDLACLASLTQGLPSEGRTVEAALGAAAGAVTNQFYDGAVRALVMLSGVGERARRDLLAQALWLAIPMRPPPPAVIRAAFRLFILGAPDPDLRPMIGAWLLEGAGDRRGVIAERLWPILHALAGTPKERIDEPELNVAIAQHLASFRGRLVELPDRLAALVPENGWLFDRTAIGPELERRRGA